MRSTMRKSGVFLCCCLMASCSWFESREARTRKLVDREMQAINWNDVDQYPLFRECDESAPKPLQKECFEQNLLQHFSLTLRDFEFVLDTDLEDTIYVDFLVDRDGTISVLDVERNSAVAEQIPEFSGVVAQSLKSLPPLAPALKRGIPVKARFRIPLVLNTSN